MSDILIKPEEYNNELGEIEKGFLGDRNLNFNDSPSSNFSSLIEILNQVARMKDLLKKYDEFLKKDVAECVKIGENFVEIDAAYANSHDGGVE